MYSLNNNSDLDDLIISIPQENNQMVDYRTISIFKYLSNDYIALTPVNEEDTSNIVLFRLKNFNESDETVEIAELESDEELETAFEGFKQSLENVPVTEEE